MLCLVDFLALIERSQEALTPTGQERLEQLAYSQQAASQPKKKTAAEAVVQPKPDAVKAPCCEAATI